MAITKKILVVFVISVFLFISSVQSSDILPGLGKPGLKKCFVPCLGGEDLCKKFCDEINFNLYAHCDSGKCCCMIKNINSPVS